jgi:hypothetical protein
MDVERIDLAHGFLHIDRFDRTGGPPTKDDISTPQDVDPTWRGQGSAPQDDWFELGRMWLDPGDNFQG